MRVTCPDCAGTGKKKRIWHFRIGGMPSEVDCSYDCVACNGKGYINWKATSAK